MEPATKTPPPAMPLAGRMLNIFAAPGEVFDAVQPAPPATVNWLVPLLLAIVMSILSVTLIYSQPAVIQQIQDQQTKALDDQVKAGKLTRAQADQATAMSQKYFGPAFVRLMGIISASVTSLIHLFWWALILWGLGRFLLRADVAYVKALEVAGLGSLILILGGLVSALLTVCLGKISTLSLALFAPQLGMQSLVHMALQSVDFFDLWFLGVMTIGLARLARVPWTRAWPLTVAYWLVMEGILLGISWLFVALSSGFK
jgi:hypothetical protein